MGWIIAAIVALMLVLALIGLVIDKAVRANRGARFDDGHPLYEEEEDAERRRREND